LNKRKTFMLQRLHIRNYAIIDDLEIDFERGLNIITGETGAGKSILMGALGLVLGNRADTSVLLDGGEKCFVEATFDAGRQQAVSLALAELELDEEETLILRREIAASGKSRSFINDTPVTLQGLRQVASLLVDLHRQFDSLTLGEDAFQFEVLDSLAGNGPLMKKYNDAFIAFRKMEAIRKKLKDQQDAAQRELDYTRFLFNELEGASFKPDELELLEAEAGLLSNAEGIKSAIAQVIFALDENEPSLVQQVKQLANQVSGEKAGLPELAEQSDRLHSVHIELQDIARELTRINDRVGLDPERLQQVNDRLSEGYRLLKKHQLQSTSALLQLQESLGEKLHAIENIEEELARATAGEAKLRSEALEIAMELSRARKKVLAPLEKTTGDYLAQMGMPNARLKASCSPADTGIINQAIGPMGIDTVQFLFDANKTGRFEPLEKVASGGELSRLMLAIKAQVAQSVHLPALIFDEIDSGISGEAARQVGILMKQLASGHQVISITHQPQIAARADAHYFVYKQETAGSIKTRLRKLGKKERVDTIARMLGGEALTEAAMATAREMVEKG
jgi:DNA repair protein RecN (Recombination protein N)